MNDENVKEYFEQIASEFDGIYDNKGNFITKIFNKIFRKGMYERVNITIEESGQVQNKTILDIGCGSGRVSFLLAKEGAEVIGIDYSNQMIELAKKNRRQLSQNNSIEFKCCDFMHDFPHDRKYDISIALGVFDYIQDPIPFLDKVKKITKSKIIASYPVKFAFQSPLRKLWLRSRNCPVYFYTEENLKKIYSRIGINEIKIISVPKDSQFPTGYLVIANLN